jgi:HEAT repeat protein
MTARSAIPAAKFAGLAALWIALGSTTLTCAQPEPAAAEPAATTDLPDPHVQAVLETSPTTPYELVRAIEVLIDLRQAAAAVPLVEKLVAAQLDDKACFELMESFGPATFLKIARSQPLGPSGARFANQIKSGSARYARDPQRIDELLAQLGDPSSGIRNHAVEALRIAGADVVVDVLRVLADPARPEARDAAARAIDRIGDDAIGPLVGALRAPDSQLVAHAAYMLGRLRAESATNRLLRLAYSGDASTARAAAAAVSAILGHLPAQQQAAAYLHKQAHDYLAGRNGLPRGRRSLDSVTDPPRLSVWDWDAASQSSVARLLSPEQARIYFAAEAATDALHITPAEDPAYRARQRTYLATTLALSPLGHDAATIRAQFPRDLQPLLESDGPTLLAVLDESRSFQLPAAARAACSLLAQQQPDPSLFVASSEPNALMRAIADPDREVRFAALAAAMRLKPSGPFPGSSQLPLAVAYFVATTGIPKAVAAASDQEEASRLAGLAAGLGYSIATATDGSALLAAATESGDVDLILLDSTLVAPRPIDMIPMLRNDPRTAGLPIALVIVPGEEDFYRRLLARDHRTGAIIRPHNRQALAFQLEQLRAQSGYQSPGAATRVDQAEAALQWAAELGQIGDHVYNLQRLIAPASQALYSPQLAAAATRALAVIGQPEAQRTLADFASQSVMPLASRQAAAAAFCQSVQRWGVLLTIPQLELQYDRYNQSEHLDRPTQLLLSSMLDAIEAGRSSAPVATALP